MNPHGFQIGDSMFPMEIAGLVVWFLIALLFSRIVQLCGRHADLRQLTRLVEVDTFSDETAMQEQDIAVRSSLTMIVSYVHSGLIGAAVIAWAITGLPGPLVAVALTSLLMGGLTAIWLWQYKIADDRRLKKYEDDSPSRPLRSYTQLLK